jgi:hypothetical protein
MEERWYRKPCPKCGTVRWCDHKTTIALGMRSVPPYGGPRRPVKREFPPNVIDFVEWKRRKGLT